MNIEQRISHLFVYGTLLQDYPYEINFNITDHANFIGKGFVKGKLYLVSDYPGLTTDGFNDKVRGEVYELNIPEIILPAVDKFEEYIYGDYVNSEYIRDVTDVYLEDGQKVKAWTYFYNYQVDEKNRISSGDFLQALNGAVKRHSRINE